MLFFAKTSAHSTALGPKLLRVLGFQSGPVRNTEPETIQAVLAESVILDNGLARGLTIDSNQIVAAIAGGPFYPLGIMDIDLLFNSDRVVLWQRDRSISLPEPSEYANI